MNFELNKSIEILKTTPYVLKSLLTNLSNEWINSNEGKDTWSCYDIVGHLIHGEKTDWITRSKIILDNDSNKKFSPFDRFAQFENSKGKNLNQLLEEFELLRMNNISKLKSFNISNKDLHLEGIHPEFGVINLKQLLATWVAHDLSHLSQISRVLAFQYKNEVGPWTAYLGIYK